MPSKVGFNVPPHLFDMHIPYLGKLQDPKNHEFSLNLQISPMRSVASGSAQQVAISSSYHDIVAPTSAVWRLLLQARLPGTRCQTISVIHHLAKTLLGDY